MAVQRKNARRFFVPFPSCDMETWFVSMMPEQYVLTGTIASNQLFETVEIQNFLESS